MSERTSSKVFILIADPDISEESLTRKVVATSIETLKSGGYRITQTDLAKDGWLDVMSPRDFVRISDPSKIDFQIEQMTSPLIQKIVDEQDKLLNCDLFMVFAPLSWCGPPSHFYSWWQRVVTYGKFFGPGKIYNKGACAGKRALMVMTSTMRQDQFGRDTHYGTVEEILYPITHGMLYLVGFRVYRTQTIFIPNPAQFYDISLKWQTALHDIEERTSIMFNSPNDYTNWQLSTSQNERRNDFELIQRAGDMSIQEATLNLKSSLET